MRQEARDRTGNTAIALKWGRVFDQETSSNNIEHCQSKAASMKRANKIELDRETNRARFNSGKIKLVQRTEDKWNINQQ